MTEKLIKVYNKFGITTYQQYSQKLLVVHNSSQTLIHSKIHLSIHIKPSIEDVTYSAQQFIHVNETPSFSYTTTSKVHVSYGKEVFAIHVTPPFTPNLKQKKILPVRRPLSMVFMNTEEVISVSPPPPSFRHTIQSHIEVNSLVHCCNLSDMNVIHVYSQAKQSRSTKLAKISVKDGRPDYLTILGDCNYSLLQQSDNRLPEIIVYVRIGEFGKILELPPSVDDEIEIVYNKPFGISYDKKKIYGRIITQKEVNLFVKLKSGKVFKVILKPYLSSTIESLFGG